MTRLDVSSVEAHARANRSEVWSFAGVVDGERPSLLGRRLGLRADGGAVTVDLLEATEIGRVSARVALLRRMSRDGDGLLVGHGQWLPQRNLELSRLPVYVGTAAVSELSDHREHASC